MESPSRVWSSSGSARRWGWCRLLCSVFARSWSRCRRFLRRHKSGSRRRTPPSPARCPPAWGRCCSGTWCCWRWCRRCCPHGPPRGAGKRWARHWGSTEGGTSRPSWRGEQETQQSESNLNKSQGLVWKHEVETFQHLNPELEILEECLSSFLLLPKHLF